MHIKSWLYLQAAELDLPSASRDVAVAASAQPVAVALPQKHRFTGVVAAKQVLEPGDAESQREHK